MKDKKIYDLMEDINDVDKLDFDCNKWEEFNLSDEEIEKIKNKTYEKLNKSTVKKHSNK